MSIRATMVEMETDSDLDGDDDEVTGVITVNF